MNEAKKCGQCQREIPSHAPFGICPVCVLNLATENSQTQEADSDPKPVIDAVAQPHELSGKFPNLEIVSLLGRGGMGAVYLARQTSLDRIVALKVLSSGLAEDPSFTERFAREAKTLAKLTHPNIVTVFDSGQTGDANYLVMEYIEGVNLRDAIVSNTIDPARSLAIVQQICDALQHAHNAGVVHRDIKPENILIDRNGLVKIADFGLAKLVQPKPEQFSLTETRQVLGTRNYMAPEQIETPESVDHRADLYSLGVVLYELLTGELPIGRFAPPSAKSGCSKRLDDLVMRTLEKDPGKRFQQASMIGSAVRELESSIGKQSGGPSLVEAITRTERVGVYASNRNQPLTEPIPFSISNMKSEANFPPTGKMTMNIAKAQGLLHAFDDRIEMEYRIHDPLGQSEPKLEVVPISLDDLSSVQFEPTWWGGAQLRFQAMSLSSVEQIPKARQGAFYVNVKQRDRSAANEFADTANRKILSRNPNRSGAKRNRNFEPAVKLEDIVLVDERLKVPCIGFWISALATFLTGIALTAASVMSFYDPEVNSFMRNTASEFGPHVRAAVHIVGPCFLLASVLPWLAANSLKRHRNYHLCIVLLLAMLTPFVSPLFIMQIPLAIWALVVLCLPTTRRVFHDASLKERLAVNKKPVVKRPPQAAYYALGLFSVLVWVFVIAFDQFESPPADSRPVAIGVEATREIPDWKRVDITKEVGSMVSTPAPMTLDIKQKSEVGSTVTVFDSDELATEPAVMVARGRVSESIGLLAIGFLMFVAMALIGTFAILAFVWKRSRTNAIK